MGQATGEGDTIEEAIAVLATNLSARMANLSDKGGALVPKSTQNSGKTWTPGEVAQLRDLARHITPTRVVGLKLGRTPDAVQSKASDKGISPRTIVGLDPQTARDADPRAGRGALTGSSSLGR
jgi:hypothetical protein